MNMLKVKGTEIVDTKDRPVRLRGFGVGGWMNSENFINGYPGFESGLRAALAEELGPAKAEFLWDRMLDCFLAEDDIKLMKELGCTVVRLPLNYRHLNRNPLTALSLNEDCRVGTPDCSQVLPADSSEGKPGYFHPSRM